MKALFCLVCVSTLTLSSAVTKAAQFQIYKPNLIFCTPGPWSGLSIWIGKPATGLRAQVEVTKKGSQTRSSYELPVTRVASRNDGFTRISGENFDLAVYSAKPVGPGGVTAPGEDDPGGDEYPATYRGFVRFGAYSDQNVKLDCFIKNK